MDNPRFPILGAEIPRLLAREAIMARIWSDLTKATPSNLSLVGPRYVGKTVIMNALAQRAADEASPYSFALHWHLGHVAPVSDDDFIAQLCEKLQACLAASGRDTSDYRSYLKNCSFAELREVTDALDDEGQAILMLWDGFDKPLGQGKLSGHLWDQMRTLFYGKKHKIITATRKPLRELIRSQDAITSPFWNIFDMNPVRLQAFDSNDCEAVLGELADYNFQAGAKTELINWTSGFPPLFLGVLNQIVRDNPGSSVSNEAVNQAAEKALGELSDIVADVWQDCPAGAQDLYLHLVDRGDLSSSEAGRLEAACLLEKGFAGESGRKLNAICRMLQRYLQGQGQDTGSMGRLFGTWDDYRANIRSLLERRLAQMSRFDDRLYRLVARAIEDIPDYPDDCLNNLTSIEERALDLIWQREFGESKIIPQETIDYWDKIDPFGKIVQRIKEQVGNTVPDDRGIQCGILQLLTGSRMKFETRAKHTTKDTYVLINAIHSFRNRDQHPGGQAMKLGVAVAALMACLELLGCLEREL